MQPLYHESIPDVPGIYRIANTINGKIYIGSAICLRARRNQHFSLLRKGMHHNPILQNAFNKYGESAFVFEVIELVLIPEMLTTREQYWFKKIYPFGRNGYNILRIANSPLGVKRSPETIEKMRHARPGWKHSEESKQKMSKSRTGRKHTPEAIKKMQLAQAGHIVTDETRAKISKAKQGSTLTLESRAKMSASHKGYKHTPEARAKMSAAQMGNKKGLGNKNALGYRHTPETRAKMSATRKGRPSHMRGKKLSPEHIEKLKIAQKGKVISPETREKLSISNKAAKSAKMKTLIVTDPNGNTYKITGIRQFCKEHNLDRSTLLRVAKGKYTHHKGWTARFYTSETQDDVS